MFFDQAAQYVGMKNCVECCAVERQVRGVGLGDGATVAQAVFFGAALRHREAFQGQVRKGYVAAAFFGQIKPRPA